jgi:predicted RNase H-like nuclease (RuvC/YqgF family)
MSMTAAFKVRSVVLGVGICLTTVASAQGVVYRCPGPPVLYTDQITPQQAKERNCRSIEGAPITVVSPPKPKPAASPSASASPAAPAASGENRVDRNEQRARDSDARRILENELRQEEERLKELERDYNNGEPERRGDERNFEKYQERTNQLKAALERKQSDVAAIRRELSKLGSSLSSTGSSAPASKN